jgi:hypothetical protein
MRENTDEDAKRKGFLYNHGRYAAQMMLISHSSNTHPLSPSTLRKKRGQRKKVFNLSDGSVRAE